MTTRPPGVLMLPSKQVADEVSQPAPENKEDTVKKAIMMGVASLGLAGTLAVGSASPASAISMPWDYAAYATRVAASAAGWLAGGGSADTIPWGDIEADALAFLNELE